MQHISYLGKQSCISLLLFLKKSNHLVLLTLFRSWNLAGICPVFHWGHWAGRRHREGPVHLRAGSDGRGPAYDQGHGTLGGLQGIWECHPGNSTGEPIPLCSHPKKAVVQLLESPGAVSSLSHPSCSFFPAVETSPVLQENYSVGLADKVMDLCFCKILKSSWIEEQSLAVLLTEVPRTALNWNVPLLYNVQWLVLHSQPSLNS